MKKYIILTVIFLINIINTSYSKSINKFPQDTTITYFKSLVVSDFYGIKVDSFLRIIPRNYISKKIVAGKRLENADRLRLVYSNSLEVDIVIKHFQFMNRKIDFNNSDSRINWDFNLIKNELIGYIIVFNGSTCINGCENE